MKKHYVIESTLVHSETIGVVSIEEACHICQVELELFHELVIEGVLEFSGRDSSYWVLDTQQLSTLKKAARLHRDLGVNPPGIALVLDLMRQRR
jgi:chaperone modulatory protein CbpM